jgi:hypothetical protein
MRRAAREERDEKRMMLVTARSKSRECDDLMNVT